VFKIFPLAQNVQTGSRMGNIRSLPRDEASKHEADHSPPSTTKVKNEWSHISNPPTSWHLHPFALKGKQTLIYGKKQAIFGNINVTNFLATTRSIID
jgi:hypothetical protein